MSDQVAKDIVNELEAIIDSADVISAKLKAMNSDVAAGQVERSLGNLKVSVSTIFLYITALYPHLHKTSEKLRKAESEALEMMFKRLRDNIQ